MEKNISVAIETSCRAGGAALGVGDELAGTVAFDASARHTAQLLIQLDGLLKGGGYRPADISQVYVSAGPGSFTGLRVGVTVVRTLAQQLPHVRCVAVPTALAVAENVRETDWRHLGVVMDAKDEFIYATLLTRRDGRIVPAGESGVTTAVEFLAAAPRPLVLVGEGLRYHEIGGPEITVPDPADDVPHLPTVEGVWRVGRRLAAAGRFTPYAQLLPIYARKSEAERLWEQRHGPAAT